MTDHLVEADLIATRGDRREEAAGLDLAELGGIADEDELRVGPLGVVDQPRQRRRVNHPRLVDQEDRARPKRRPTVLLAGVWPGEQPGDGARVETLGAQDVRRPPGRRGDDQLVSARRPALCGGDGGVGLAGAGLADHDLQGAASAEEPADHRLLVRLQAGVGGEDAGDDDRVD